MSRDTIVDRVFGARLGRISAVPTGKLVILAIKLVPVRMDTHANQASINAIQERGNMDSLALQGMVVMMDCLVNR